MSSFTVTPEMYPSHKRSSSVLSDKSTGTTPKQPKTTDSDEGPQFAMDGAESLPDGLNGTHDIDNLTFGFFEVNRSNDNDLMSICDERDEREHAELYQAMGELVEMPKYHSWLKLVAGTATYKDEDVAQVFAQIVDRTDCRHRFHAEMSAPEPGDLGEFAWSLFDKRGNLRKELQCHDSHKGSGVWGEELNDGYLVLISFVRVDKKWRRKGIGRKLIQGIEKLIATKVSANSPADPPPTR